MTIVRYPPLFVGKLPMTVRPMPRIPTKKRLHFRLTSPGERARTRRPPALRMCRPQHPFPTFNPAARAALRNPLFFTRLPNRPVLPARSHKNLIVPLVDVLSWHWPLRSMKGTQTVLAGQPATFRSWWLVQGNAKPDLDLPAPYRNLFDHRAQQLLPLFEVEIIDVGANRCRESGDPLAQGVVSRRFLALVSQLVTLLLQGLSAIPEILASAQQLVAVEIGLNRGINIVPVRRCALAGARGNAVRSVQPSVRWEPSVRHRR